MSVGHWQIGVYIHKILAVSKQGTMAEWSFVYTDISQRQNCSEGRKNLVGLVKPLRAEPETQCVLGKTYIGKTKYW